MSKDEALKLAMEALKNAYWPTESDLMPAHNTKECAEAITAIKKALAQPEQEPCKTCNGTGEVQTGIGMMVCDDCHGITYTTPPKRKPLTDDEIQNTLLGYRLVDAIDITRAIEAAHGIKE